MKGQPASTAWIAGRRVSGTGVGQFGASVAWKSHDAPARSGRRSSSRSSSPALNKLAAEIIPMLSLRRAQSACPTAASRSTGASLSSPRPTSQRGGPRARSDNHMDHVYHRDVTCSVNVHPQEPAGHYTRDTTSSRHPSRQSRRQASVAPILTHCERVGLPFRRKRQEAALANQSMHAIHLIQGFLEPRPGNAPREAVLRARPRRPSPVAYLAPEHLQRLALQAAPAQAAITALLPTTRASVR